MANFANYGALEAYERARAEQERYLHLQQYAMQNAGMQQMPRSLADALGIKCAPTEPEPNPVLLLL